MKILKGISSSAIFVVASLTEFANWLLRFKPLLFIVKNRIAFLVLLYVANLFVLDLLPDTTQEQRMFAYNYSYVFPAIFLFATFLLMLYRLEEKTRVPTVLAIIFFLPVLFHEIVYQINYVDPGIKFYYVKPLIICGVSYLVTLISVFIHSNYKKG